MATKETQLPATGFVRLPTILAHFPVSRSKWYVGVKAGEYPPAIKLSSNIVAWRSEDIHALLKRMGEATIPSKKEGGVTASPRGICKNLASSLGPPTQVTGTAAEVLPEHDYEC